MCAISRFFAANPCLTPSWLRRTGLCSRGLVRRESEQSGQGGALLLLNIGQLLALRAPSPTGARRGRALRELGIIPGAAVLCLGGKVVSVGKISDALKDPWVRKHHRRLTKIDCAGGVVLPGFVDSHTHPVFAAP